MSQSVIPSSEIERVSPEIVQAFIDERIPSTAAHESLRAMRNDDEGARALAAPAYGYLPNNLRPITQYDPQTVANLAILNFIKSLERPGESDEAGDEKDFSIIEANLLGKSWHMAGAAVTCRLSPGDNLYAHAAVEQCSTPGAALVVAATMEGNDESYGNWGDLLIEQLRYREVAGMVIDGSTRDTENLIRSDFKTWARLPSIQGTSKERDGSVNQLIFIGGTSIAPGDLVVADVDGICVVPRPLAAEVLKRSRERIASEDATRAGYAKGAMSLDGKRSLRKVIARLDAATL